MTDAPQTDDMELCRRWAAADRGAGRQLVERHFNSVARFFGNKTANPSDVEDLTAETFERLMRSIEGFEGRGSFRSYLFSVAYRTLADYHRRLCRGEEVELEEASIAQLGASPSSQFRHHRRRRLLLDALRSIPVHAQVVIELSVFEGLARSEIAQVLDLPEGTIASRIRRGRAQLDQALERLASDPTQLKSTQDDLRQWAQRIRSEAERKCAT